MFARVIISDVLVNSPVPFFIDRVFNQTPLPLDM